MTYISTRKFKRQVALLIAVQTSSQIRGLVVINNSNYFELFVCIPLLGPAQYLQDGELSFISIWILRDLEYSLGQIKCCERKVDTVRVRSIMYVGQSPTDCRSADSVESR